MIARLRTAAILLLTMTLLTGIAYPAAITLIAQLVFPHQANGSLVMVDGVAVGSELLGQSFASARYFWSRPSATGPAPYNGAASSGSNLAPSNPAFREAVAERVAAIRKAHPDQKGPVPVDLVTASASGLDPHISPAAAAYQAGRIAEARAMPIDEVKEMIARATQGRTFGILGEPRVNVLKLNLALDARRKS